MFSHFSKTLLLLLVINPHIAASLGQNEVLLLRGLDDGEREDESYGEDAKEQREDALRYIVDLLGKSLPVTGVRGDKQLRTP